MPDEAQIPSASASVGFTGQPQANFNWQGPSASLAYTEEDLRRVLLALDKPVWAVRSNSQVGLSNEGAAVLSTGGEGVLSLLGSAPALTIDQLGDPAFRATYGVRFAYYTGAMANAIASESLVVALGNAGILASFGAAGLSPSRIEAAIERIQAALPDGPYAFNLINSPNEPALEARTVELFLKHGVRTVEASAYLSTTPGLVRYRAAGLSLAPDGKILVQNRIIIKLSRLEVARRFLAPAPADLLKTLVQEGKISEEQALLAQQVPLADDVTVEADSAGHTDNRPLVCMVPAFLSLRDEFQAKYHFPQLVRVGAAGGIGTPAAALAAFMLGAAYVVTGSVNQACVEAGASEFTRNLLAKTEMADVGMAPAADMFEMGVKVQVLKRGTMFAMRGQKLYDLYSHYASLDEIPAQERERLETQVFKKDLDTIWNETVQFFKERDPSQIERANANPKDKMALVFRWYLGLSSRWSNSGEKGREMDYQVWCGPAMGAFNQWTRGTYLAEPANRRVVDVALQLLSGCAYLYRLRMLALQGLRFSANLERYFPSQPLA
jgi:trans-AT polyketide synthase/acyltransferase/oxidoreductase domain-containing protein